MIKRIIKTSVLFLLVFVSTGICCAYELSDAKTLLDKAKTASLKEEKYDYINQAREIYFENYMLNQTDIDSLIGLSKTYQMIGDRKEAKLYVLKAYNIRPYDAYLQREMADFYYSFQEYSTAIEYYKLALASGLLRDFDTNLKTAKCYEKLGDLENAELYYKICNHLNSHSQVVLNKLNEYESSHHKDNTDELENAKYKYLFKDKPLSESEQNDKDAEKIIEQLN